MPHAVVKWLQNKQFVGIDSSRHSVVLSSQDEDNGIGMKPSDLLLVALGACAAVDVVEILAKKRTPLTSLDIEISGEQDPEPPWTYRRVHMIFRVRGAGITPASLDQAIRLSEEKYCSVAATVRGTAEITYEYQILE